MRENFKACIWQNAKGNYDVTMYYQCADGTFRPIFDADNMACVDAAYLQRKSQFHESVSLFYDYILVLYDYEKRSMVLSTNIATEFHVAISGICDVNKLNVVKFISGILSAVNNLDIRGTLYVNYAGNQTIVKHDADVDALLL